MSWGVALRNAVGLGISGIPSVSTSALPSPTVSFDFTKGTLDPLITFTRASSATYFDSSGVLQTATTNTPRFDYNPSTLATLGLLTEEQRTNSIRNNTATGAVAGAPGTMPTYWTTSFNTVTGLSREIIGTGTENGVNYLDIKISGTASGSGSFDVIFEAANSVGASNNEVWAASLFWKLIDGSTNGLSAPILYLYEYTSAGGFLTAKGFVSPSFPTSQSLSIQRITGSNILTGGATTAFIRPLLKINVANAATIDITLRIGLPQLEKGLFATSVIPTSTVAITRSADVAKITGTNFSNFFNFSQGTLFVKAMQSTLSSASKTAASVSDGTNSNRLTLYSQSSNNISCYTNPGSVSVSGPIAIANTSWKSAIAYDASPASFAANGNLQSSLSYTVLPSLFTELAIGNSYTGGNEYFNGYIQSLSYYQKRLNNSKLQIITT